MKEKFPLKSIPHVLKLCWLDYKYDYRARKVINQTFHSHAGQELVKEFKRARDEAYVSPESHPELETHDPEFPETQSSNNAKQKVAQTKPYDRGNTTSLEATQRRKPTKWKVGAVIAGAGLLSTIAYKPVIDGLSIAGKYYMQLDEEIFPHGPDEAYYNSNDYARTNAEILPARPAKCVLPPEAFLLDLKVPMASSEPESLDTVAKETINTGEVETNCTLGSYVLLLRKYNTFDFTSNTAPEIKSIGSINQKTGQTDGYFTYVDKVPTFAFRNQRLNHKVN